MLHLIEVALAITLMGEANIDNLDPKEVVCMAQNVYHEARGESVEGQQAVAHVTLNRVSNDAYPDTVCSVVHQPKQFSWTKNASIQINDPVAYENALMVAIAAMTGLSADPTGGATHYYDNGRVHPSWSARMRTTSVIGEHTFKRIKN